MNRKYIYILVIMLTFALVSGSYYSDLKQAEKASSAIVDIEEPEEDAYKGVEVSSPLLIKNTQNDNRKLSYLYKINIENAVGSYRYIQNSEEKYLVFNAIGEASIYLKSNESITIYNLPLEAKYKVEQTTDVSEYYKTTINNKETKIAEGTLSLNNSIEFKNNTLSGTGTSPVKPTEPSKEEVKPNDKEENKEPEQEIKPEQKPEEDKEDEIIVDKNPVTGDLSSLAILCFVFSTIVLVLVKSVKVRRFE